MKKAGLLGVTALALGCAFPVADGRAEATTLPSDKAVESIMNYAWAMLPGQFTNKDGKVIVVDKTKRESVEVPKDVAREVVRVGTLSAHAQACNLPEEQSLNHRSLMKREVDKKTWTDQQKLWINQLHLTTVMVLTGKIKAVETEGGKEISVVETKAATNTCTPEQAQAVKDKIKAYVDAGPQLPPAAPAAAAANAPAPGAAPTTTAATPPPAATGSTAAAATKPAAPLPAAAVAPAPEKK